MATLLENNCQEYNFKSGTICTNKAKLRRTDGKQVCSIHKNIHTKKCRENGCKKQPVFGTEKGIGLYCSEHKKDGMIDVKHDTCQEEGCKKRPAFGIKKGVALYCSAHKKNGMFDVKNKTCQEEGCKKHPVFGTERGVVLYCFEHKKDGMFDVKNKTCQEEGCKKRPVFGTEKGIGLYCSEHKKDGMIDVISKTCQEEGCKKIPVFGTEKGIGLYCFEHKKDGMFDVKNKTCQEEGCKKQPVFGTEKGVVLYCSVHKKDGMSNVKDKTCQEEGCKKQPVFGTERGVGLYCFEHKKDGMFDVKDKTCQEEGCKKRPYYGSHLTGKIHCTTHYNKEREWKITNCKKCKKIAINSETGNLPFIYCENHCPSNYSSKLSSTCVSCNLTDLICDEEGKCLLACSSMHLTRIKYTENEMLNFLTSKKLQFVNDKTASDGCSKKRPDFVFKTNYGIIIVENDENQHKSYACECEQTRMIKIHQDYGENVHFIRFNPDRYSIQDRKTEECLDLDKRHKLLFGILKPILKYSEEFFRNHSGLTVRYMFYDNCDGQYRVQTIFY